GAALTLDPQRRASGVELRPGARVGVCLRAEALHLVSENGVFSGTVVDVEYAGSVRTCVVETDLGKLQVEVPSSAGRPMQGQPVQLTLLPSAVYIVGPEGSA